MYERFTDRSRKAMQRANQAAQRWNHGYIGPEHVLLGLLKVADSVACHVLELMGMDPRHVGLDMEKAMCEGTAVVPAGRLPHSPLARKVVELAIEEARGLGHNHIGTEHLLLGLVQVAGVAGQAPLGGLEALSAGAVRDMARQVNAGLKRDRVEPAPESAPPRAPAPAGASEAATQAREDAARVLDGMADGAESPALRAAYQVAAKKIREQEKQP